MRHSLVSFGVCSLLLFVTACHPQPGPDKSFAGAILGAGWGAGSGAIIGNQLNHTGPGAAIGAGFGAASGLLTGVGLDLSEGTALQQQRELDALKVQVGANTRSLMALQDSLDAREQGIKSTTISTEIFFDSSLASIRRGAAEQLQRFAQSIKLNPYVGHIELHGHSDDMGDSEQNLKLSEARARTVATFLVNQGISFHQISVIPHGASLPLTTNQTEAGRQLNRRVEIVLRK